MARFVSTEHLASWAGVCPGHHESPPTALRAPRSGPATRT
ncbi:transposase [Streptomyces canus]